MSKIICEKLLLNELENCSSMDVKKMVLADLKSQLFKKLDKEIVVREIPNELGTVIRCEISIQKPDDGSKI